MILKPGPKAVAWLAETQKPTSATKEVNANLLVQEHHWKIKRKYLRCFVHCQQCCGVFLLAELAAVGDSALGSRTRRWHPGSRAGAQTGCCRKHLLYALHVAGVDIRMLCSELEHLAL